MKNIEQYYIGVDIGTNSLGWAVSDGAYNLVCYKGNGMWGTRLFDESKPALETRNYRSGTRRLNRRKERIDLLEMLFAKAISEKDMAFYRRLAESNLYEDDKSGETHYAVFADKDYTDKDFHKEFPTVFHLRKELIENSAPHDVRFVYLAIHHIIKHRGHFLFESLDAGNITSFEMLFEDLKSYLSDEMEIELVCNDMQELKDTLKSKALNKSEKHKKVLELCNVNKKETPDKAAILSLLCGKSEKLSVIFDDETLDEEETNKADLTGDFEEKSHEYEQVLGDRYELIDKLKAIYDWAILADILRDEKYISFAKVKSYEKHKSDLALLKKFVRQRCPEKYSEIFKISQKGLNNYTAYSGKIKKNGKTGVLENKCTQADFCAYLKKVLNDTDKTDFEDMFNEIESADFMPKQHIKDNSVIPMQLHYAELCAILENAKTYLPFLNEADESGKTVIDKIYAIFTFRIPYYVGPLNKHSQRHWLERKEGKIYPWNFSEIVDLDASAENFISNLTNKCTYLPKEDVLPKKSILYSRYSVLNELNNLRIDGDKIDVETKQDIFNSLFLTRKKVTKKALENYFKSKYGETPVITGIDGDCKSSMESYIDLKGYGLNEAEMEDIITQITIFGEDKKRLRKRIGERFNNKLTDEDINKICNLKYTGWGKFSKKFLTEITGVLPKTGEVTNIITALWETNDNHNALLGSAYNFADSLKAESKPDENLSVKKMIDELYVSPMVKRPIHQTLQVIDEIVKIMGKPPKKIFVEVTRAEEEVKKRTVSRKDALMSLYKSCKEEAGELFEKLNAEDNEKLRNDKLYLYYTQLGRSMYTGKIIPIDSLMSTVYDIDHIYPQSKVKDDSLDNRVLVEREINEAKGNKYPLDDAFPDIKENMLPFWNMLLDKGLISKKKYDRLVRNSRLTDDELSDFINRQIVQTSQANKAVAHILEALYPNTSIIYSKAKFVSEFRHDYDMLKCREVNDLHHAKDAYLNIVVGNVYDERFTRSRANFIKGLQSGSYSLNRMFDFDTEGAWDKDESISIVRKTMNKNNILYTRYSFCQHGSLFDITPLKKGSGQVPQKGSGALSDISRYGGYNRATATYFSLVKYIEKGEEIKALIPINLYQKAEYEANPEKFLSENMSISEPEVLIKCVKYNACLEVDGFRMHISSKSNGGKQIVCKPAMQLVIGYEKEKYVKALAKYMEKFSFRPVNSFDHISAEENIDLFDTLVNKMTNTVLKIKFGDKGREINEKRDKFISLSVEKQCKVLLEILKIVHANVMTGDLTDIGLAGKSGAVTANSKLSPQRDYKKIDLVFQSVTGLYENRYSIYRSEE